MSNFPLFKFLSLLLFASLHLQLLAQPACIEINSWEQYRYTVYPDTSAGAKVVVLSNRPLADTSRGAEMMPNLISQQRKLTYFVATCAGSTWELAETGSFLQAMQAADNGRDILFFIDGHGKSLPLALQRAYQISMRYDITVVLFDWPSMNRNFNKSLARVRRCAGNFYNSLLMLSDYRDNYMAQGQSLSLITHSLANYFVSYTVVGGSNQFINAPIFDNVVLHTAAIRSKEHAQALTPLKLGKQLYIITNENDFILRGATMLTTGVMLGNKAIAPYVERAEYYDFTPIAGNAHSFFAGLFEFEHNHPFVFSFYGTIFKGKKFSPSGSAYLSSGPASNLFSVIPVE
jgi:hypothetical protein